MLLDYDEIDLWDSSLTGALGELVPANIASRMGEAEPEFVEDARDLLLEWADRDSIIDRTIAWVEANTVAAYHGTRLTNDEVDAVHRVGLLPLEAAARRVRLERALRAHPEWSQVAARLDEVIERHGRGAAGSRTGQVHLTLSRAGLTSGFNHYLTHGSEFDQRVAHALLGDPGVALLNNDGAARLVKTAVPGREALVAAHPFFQMEGMRARGDLPNLAGEFLEAWSWRRARPGFQCGALRTDCGLMFRTKVDASWIVEITVWPDQP